jgi:hypothetical protein
MNSAGPFAVLRFPASFAGLPLPSPRAVTSSAMCRKYWAVLMVDDAYLCR